MGGALEADPQELAQLNERYGLEMIPDSVPELLERFGLQIGEHLRGGWTPPNRPVLASAARPANERASSASSTRSAVSTDRVPAHQPDPPHRRRVRAEPSSDLDPVVAQHPALHGLAVHALGHPHGGQRRQPMLALREQLQPARLQRSPGDAPPPRRAAAQRSSSPSRSTPQSASCSA